MIKLISRIQLHGLTYGYYYGRMWVVGWLVDGRSMAGKCYGVARIASLLYQVYCGEDAVNSGIDPSAHGNRGDEAS